MKSKVRSLSLALALAAGAPALAQPAAPWADILPPAPAWRGGSERLVAKPNDPWITPAERAGFSTTPSYAETRAYLDRLDAASPLIRQEVFGKTAEGRELVAVIVSKDGQGLDPRKPLVLIQAGIHSGEIDGKDAGLMFLRDVALRGKDRLLDGVNLVFVPIFNADGHEYASPYNRPNQRGPDNQGWRVTGQNLNLNRDYAKADTPEMQAMLGLIGRYDPDLYVDIHVTDGVDYLHDITYVFEGWGAGPARSPRLSAWLNARYRAEMDRALKAAGHFPAPYVDAVDPRAPEKGLNVQPAPPRFSTGYGDARRVATVLVENHSLKPYRQRVLGTYVLIEQTLKTAAAHGAELEAARQADQALRPERVVLSWKPKAEPSGTFDFLPVERESYVSPASGREEVRWLGKPGKPVKVPVFGGEPDVTAEAPAAYWVPATKPEVIARLKAHGIAMETLAEPRTVTVELTRLSGARPLAANEGHIPIAAEGYEPVVREVTYPAGSVRVPTAQPLGELAALLLEPRSPDGFLAWGFFPEILHRTEYVEGYVMAPLAERMLKADPKLAAEFEAKLKSDPAFAKDANARLSWFYQRTPFFDRRYLVYPVGREAGR